VAKEMVETLSFDLNMSGTVVAETREQGSQAAGIAMSGMDFSPLLTGGYDLLVRSEYAIKGQDLTLEFRLFDVINKKLIVAKRYLGNRRDLRFFTHSFANQIVGQIDKEGGLGSFTSRIAYVTTGSGNKEIALMDWDGNNIHPITRNGSINLNPVFSPDGKELLFTSYKNGNPDLFRRTLSSGVDLKLSGRKGLNITGSWSPDGTRIALSLSKDGNSEIYTLDRNGNNPVRLTVNPAIDVSPVWSPDSSRLAFVSDRFGAPQIFLMNADGSNVRRLTTSGSYNVNPAWSPKGDRIAYTKQQGGFQIYTIDVDGSNDTQLTTSGNNENPAWSPDGRFIAYSSKQGGIEAIHVMRSNGTGSIRISKGKGHATQPSWSPP
jgi:TolB protein